MLRLGINRLARWAVLVLTGLSLLGYLGYLLSDLYRSRQELQRLRQEEQVAESSRRADALGTYLAERVDDLATLAEGRAIRSYFENKALGMSMEYGLGASLHAVREACLALQAKRRLGEAHAFRRLVFLDEAGQVLADVSPPERPAAGEAAGPDAWSALLGRPDEPPRLVPDGADLVVALPYRFRPGQGGHLLAWLPLDEVLRRVLGPQLPGDRTAALLWGGRVVAPGPPGLPATAAAVGSGLADGGRARVEAEDGGPGWLAVRSDVPGTPLTLLTLIAEEALGGASPGLLVAFTGLLGLLIVAGGLASVLADRRALRGLELLLEALPCAVVLVSPDGEVALANAEARRLLGRGGGQLLGQDWRRLVPAGPDRPGAAPQEAVVATGDGARRTVLLAEVPIRLRDEPYLVEAFVDLTERKQLEAQLRQAQKLEAVGQLAAGIAHELNTPIQFVGDSVRFLQGGFEALLGLVASYRQALPPLAARAGRPELTLALAEAEEEADLGYLQENGPPAFARTLDGLARVAAIVGAMKEFAHPDQGQKQVADLNRALRTTLTIARNEYKHVAEVETDLGELPQVHCHVGALNQVFLNLLVNAAHAIAERIGPGGGRGRITVRSRHVGGLVRIDVEDDGCGIPEAVRERVFDPFFTTKEVGRGSGQGLAIARAIVVERHGGRLAFTSEVGRGTTFTLELPVEAAEGVAPPARPGGIPAPAARRG